MRLDGKDGMRGKVHTMTKSIRMAWNGVTVAVAVVVAVPVAAAAASSSCRRTMCTATSPSSASSHEQPALTSVLTSILRVIALSSTTRMCMSARIDLEVRVDVGGGCWSVAAVGLTVVGPPAGGDRGVATRV